MSPLAAVTARISSIENRFRPVTAPTRTAGAAGQSDPAFADVYESTMPTPVSTATSVASPAVPSTASPWPSMTGATAVAVPWSKLPGSVPVSTLPTGFPAGNVNTTAAGPVPAAVTATGPAGMTLEALDDRSVAAGTPFADQFDAAGRRHGVPPRLLASIGWVESRYNVNALSPDGAQGVMQLMPFISKAYGVDPHVPAQAIDAAARLLSEHHDRFGSWELSVASYFSGAGAVSKAGNRPPTTRSHGYVRSVTERLPQV